MVNASMPVFEIITLCREAADIMAAYGLHCFSCSMGGVETLADGCMLHGMDNDTVNSLVEDINDVLRAEPLRPATITVTKEAANAIAGIARAEEKQDHALIVTADMHGGFCLEFQAETPEGHVTFGHKDVPAIRVLASPLTLWRIGGATIDFREGRFKLDLAEDQCGCGGLRACSSTGVQQDRGCKTANQPISK